MSLALTITLIVLAVIILTVGGLLGWYVFYRLRKPQVFLVSVPYSELEKMGLLSFDTETSSKLATLYGGTVATMDDIKQAFNDGLYVDAAGYISDAQIKGLGCSGDQPTAYYPIRESSGSVTLGTACSRGYWIKGVKPFQRNSGVTGTPFNVQPYSDSRWNRYEVQSFSEFWKALTGKE